MTFLERFNVKQKMVLVIALVLVLSILTWHVLTGDRISATTYTYRNALGEDVLCRELYVNGELESDACDEARAIVASSKRGQDRVIANLTLNFSQNIT